jgi:voltage-gated potassium channel
MAQHMPGVRVRYQEFVAHHEVAWELTFGVLAAVFVALAFVPVAPGSSADQVLYAVEWLITAVFIAEFSSRLWAAESRRDYLRGHWIDLVSCIPPVRWARFFRLVLHRIRAVARLRSDPYVG